ncbi:MAG TPA: cation diffusion facilitator family transporter [Solirubrobacteraceae bacterium]|nr:cation diffusion facilitator family transporter [Solirubrobacteraceae bacterium]
MDMPRPMPGDDEGHSANESTRTVLVALGAGFGVALAKAGAAVFTGSSALAAEASHSLADTANDLFLFVAQRRSTRSPNDRHPLGYGREAYFWALIAACAAFVAGAAFSLRDGINELTHPSGTSSFAVAYGVLAISTAFDLVSFRQSAGQMVTRGRRYGRKLLQESQVTSDPTLRAVFTEDAVSVSGDVIALVAVALNQITGSSIPQGVAAVLIGLVLIRISLRLIKRSHDFLVGVWVLTPTPEGSDADDVTQPIRPVEAQRVRALISAYPGVTGIRELLLNFIGPGRVWIVARVDIDDDLHGAEVESLVRGIETSMMRESDTIYRVDIVPIGDVHAGDPISLGRESGGEPGRRESSPPHDGAGAGGRLADR